jgi:hypothetical protein
VSLTATTATPFAPCDDFVLRLTDPTGAPWHIGRRTAIKRPAQKKAAPEGAAVH